jgi:hypothetical protein
MSKARMMGAGNAGSTVYNSNVNLNTAGGNKKQGLPFSLNDPIINHRSIKIGAVGNKRDVIFTINQLGGVGHTAKVTRGGVKPRAPYIYAEISPLTPSVEPDLSKYVVLQIPYNVVQGLFKCRTVNGEVRLYTAPVPPILNNIVISNLNYKNTTLFQFILSHMKTAMNVSTFYNESQVVQDIFDKLALFMDLLKTTLNNQSIISPQLPFQDEYGRYALLSTPGNIAAKIFKSHSIISTPIIRNLLSRTDILEATINLSFNNINIAPLIIRIAIQLV